MCEGCRGWPVFIAGHSLGGKVALEYLRLLQREPEAEQKLPKQVQARKRRHRIPRCLLIESRFGFWIRSLDLFLLTFQPIKKSTRSFRWFK